MRERVWPWQVSGFEEQLLYKESVRCDITSSVYTGYLKACQRHGKGFIRFDDGSSYEGEFVDDEYCGNGALKLENGDRYTGEFKGSNKHGTGTFYWLDGRRYDVHTPNQYVNGRNSKSLSRSLWRALSSPFSLSRACAPSLSRPLSGLWRAGVAVRARRLAGMRGNGNSTSCAGLV